MTYTFAQNVLEYIKILHFTMVTIDQQTLRKSRQMSASALKTRASGQPQRKSRPSPSRSAMFARFLSLQVSQSKLIFHICLQA
jgi:hypothetical protein